MSFSLDTYKSPVTAAHINGMSGLFKHTKLAAGSWQLMKEFACCITIVRRKLLNVSP